MLHEEPQNGLFVFLIFKRILDLLGRCDRCTCDLDAIARDEVVGRRPRPVNELIVTKVFKQHFLVVVSLLLVHVEVFTVEVKEAVGEFVARERANNQLTVKSVKHATTRHKTSALLGKVYCLFSFFTQFEHR